MHSSDGGAGGFSAVSVLSASWVEVGMLSELKSTSLNSAVSVFPAANNALSKVATSLTLTKLPASSSV